MKEIENEILKLINSKREGVYWDFKKQWHSDNVNLLHDIICLANAKHNGNRYLIIGVDESQDFSIVDIVSDPKRKSQANLIDFLRNIPFLGDIRPSILLYSFNVHNKIIDVVIIENEYYKPYILKTNDKKPLSAGNIYTRQGDTNTPINSTADIHLVEQMWRERFGLDLTPLERLKLYLKNPDNWQGKFGDGEIIYHKQFPEFTIEYMNPWTGEYLDSWDGHEIYSFFFPNENSTFYKCALKYHSTILQKSEIVSLDGGRYSIPAPCIGFIENNILYSVENKLTYYFYYDLSTLEGSLYLFLCESIKKCPYKKFEQSILIFNNTEEKKLFEQSVKLNLNKVLEQKVSEYIQDASDDIDKKQRNLCFNLTTMIKLNLYKKELFNEIKHENRTSH